MPPSTTLWPLDDHSKGKHRVLRAYLDAWIPILCRHPGRVIFIDGFAGPGEYAGGEEGSPIIAMRAFQEHPAAQRLRGSVHYIFIEQDEARVAHLAGLVARRQAEGWSQNVRVVPGTFDATMSAALDALAGARMAPAFVMMDPFGVSDTPMAVVQRVLAHPQSEVFISVMYEHINRFATTPEMAPHLDDLYGCQEWRAVECLADPAERKELLFGLYERQLRRAGAEHVLRFELRRDNHLVYAIFFGTKHALGCDRMKQAIWKIAPLGDYSFRGTRRDQLGFDLAVTDVAGLRAELAGTFGDRWVGINELEEYVQSDRTLYHSGHLKQQTLAPMEREGLLEVHSDSVRVRRCTFPAGTRLRFRGTPTA